MTRTTTRFTAAALAAVLTAGGVMLSAAPAFAEEAPPVEEIIIDEVADDQAIVDEEDGEPGDEEQLFSPMSLEPDPAMEPGTMTLTGTPQVGNVVTVETAGWPDGATLNFEWFYNGGNFGGEITDALAAEYTVEARYIGMRVGVFVTAQLDGYADFSDSVLFDDVVFTPKKSAAEAPALDSAGLAEFLEGKGSTPESADSAGLPTGPLSPGNSYTGTVNWFEPDSFVDVYAFSTPTFVGTFPVVNGVVQFDLSSAVLAKLAAGTHTLVIMGQSTESVFSVTFGVARTLAVTGSEIGMAPFALAGALLVLGAGALAMRRRATV